MSSRVLKIVGIMAAIVVAACVDLAAPKGSPSSISQVQLASFFVVQGDTMRDTLGKVVPPSVIAYDGAGKPESSFAAKFFVTDSVQQLHFNADGTLSASGSADTAGATVHLVGQIGSLQTPAQTIYVTVRPDTLERSNLTMTDSIIPLAATDSSASIAFTTLSAVVHGIGGRPVPGVFVRYELRTNYVGKGSQIPVYLRDDANNVFAFGKSTPDTGDASGVTSRTLVLNSASLPVGSQLLTTGDTVFVVATATYKGQPLAGSPLTFRVRLKCRQFGQTNCQVP